MAKTKDAKHDGSKQQQTEKVKSDHLPVKKREMYVNLLRSGKVNVSSESYNLKARTK